MSADSALYKKLMELVDAWPNHPSEDNFFALCQRVSEDARFTSFDVDAVVSAVKAVANQSAENVDKAIEATHSLLSQKSRIFDLVNPKVDLVKEERGGAAQAYTVPRRVASGHDSGIASSSAKPTSTIEKLTAQWKGLATEHKVNIGMSGGVAALSGILALARLSHSMERDEQGKLHVNASNVFMGLVSALFAVGSGYLAVTQFKAAVR